MASLLLVFCFVGLVSRPCAADAGSTAGRGLRVRVVATVPHGLLYLLESMRGDPHHSSDIARLFRASRGEESAPDNRVLADYRDLVEGRFGGLAWPLDGNRRVQFVDLLELIAVRSETVAEFLGIVEPLLGPRDGLRLRRVLEHFEPGYRRILWEPTQADLREQKAALEAAMERVQMSAQLARVAVLVDSDWDPEISLVVALVPFPRPTGHFTTFGHSTGWLEVVEVPSGLAVGKHGGVLFHELCHSLWNARRDDALHKAFLRHGGALAWQELSEGLATALGNGWMQTLLDGRKPRGQWYHDPYTDAYGKALLPLIEARLRSGNALDEDFAVEATSVFKRAFPRAEVDPRLLSRQIVLVADDSMSAQAWIMSNAGAHGVYTGRDHEGTTMVIFVRPEDLETLRPRGFTGDQVRRLRGGGACCTKQGGRWVVACVGAALEQQGKALLRVLGQPEMREGMVPDR